MCSSSKVFICKNQGVSSESAADLSTFLRESCGIFNNQPDIVEFSSIFNADGLKCPTFVVPGGNTLMMSTKVKSIFESVLASSVREDFNYIGVCAGAFIGTETADIFSASPDFTYSLPYQGMGLVDEFKTVGAFCPVETVNPSRRSFVPYSVSISLSNTRQPSQQLYVNGPGFFAVKPVRDGGAEVVARYRDRDSFDFAYKTGIVSTNNLAAMVSKKPNEQRGGRFLSAVHFEACIEDSQMLKAFESSNSYVEALSSDDYATLGDAAEQTNTRVAVEALLRRTLK